MRVGDDLEATVAVLRAALRDVDILITTGGVSVGPHDHVRPALARLGFTEVFAGVKLKPGRPTTFAVNDEGTLVFALPGNPVSALMAFRLFVVPALDAMLGRQRELHPTMATADEELPGARGRTTIVRCRSSLQDDGWHVRPTRSQDSHILTSMLGIDALALVPGDRDSDRGRRAGRDRVRRLKPASARAEGAKIGTAFTSKGKEAAAKIRTALPPAMSQITSIGGAATSAIGQAIAGANSGLSQVSGAAGKALASAQAAKVLTSLTSRLKEGVSKVKETMGKGLDDTKSKMDAHTDKAGAKARRRRPRAPARSPRARRRSRPRHIESPRSPRACLGRS